MTFNETLSLCDEIINACEPIDYVGDLLRALATIGGAL